MKTRERVIVVVEPDEDRAASLSYQLCQRGYHVLRRASGVDAIECVVEVRPDLVLSESELLDLEARELLHSVHQASPRTRVLFIERQGMNLRLSERPEELSGTLEELPDAPEGIAGAIDHFWES